MFSQVGSSPGLMAALSMALDDEYRARATYQAVLRRFGQVPPFAAIVGAEQRHIEALLSLFARYGMTPPADRWSGAVAAPASLQQACFNGVLGEIGNYKMYEQLLTQVIEPDVRATFMNLHDASAYRHLPAFQACAAQLLEQPLPDGAAAASLKPNPTALWLGVAAGISLAWWLRRAAGGSSAAVR